MEKKEIQDQEAHQPASSVDSMLQSMPKPTAEQQAVGVVSVAPMKTFVRPLYAVIILLGISTGFFLSRSTGFSMLTQGKATRIQTEKIAGITDEKTFKDSADGTIEKGGIDGEGTHQLIREGGPSQTAYLVSSVVDLDAYAGKKVKVWGQTMAAEKASWLMDVGKIELQE